MIWESAGLPVVFGFPNDKVQRCEHEEGCGYSQDYCELSCVVEFLYASLERGVVLVEVPVGLVKLSKSAVQLQVGVVQLSVALVQAFQLSFKVLHVHVPNERC